MDFHANHALGLPQRLALVQAIERGSTLRAAAAALSVAPATAHRWWHRFRLASPQQRRSLTWAHDRSSRPRSSPRRLTEAEEAPILRARALTNLGPGRLAGLVRRARSTVLGGPRTFAGPAIVRRRGSPALREAVQTHHIGPPPAISGPGETTPAREHR
jgi:transposase-like protein